MIKEQNAGYTKFRRKLVVGYLILCALLFALLGWKVLSEYESDRQAAAAVTKNSARAMAAHVGEIIDAVDQSLRISASAISALDESALTPDAVLPLLAVSSQASDSRHWLLFIDASGKGVVASSGLPVRDVSFADRSYFLDASVIHADQLHVGGPAIGHVSKRRLFFLSRRVESPSGKFLGVIAAPVDAKRVADVFERARLGPEMSISLTMKGSMIVARAPLFEESFGADLSGLVRPNPAVLIEGTFEADSPFRGERRLFSYTPVASLPLMVVVGVTRDSWAADSRSDFIAGLVGLAVALIVALFSGRVALEQYMRLERVEASQRKLIDQLHCAKMDLARGERRLRMIADSVTARVAYVNADERYTYHNTGPSGAPSGASLGKTLLETHGPEVYEAIKKDARQALSGERVDVERIYVVDGQSRCFKHQYTPDFTSEGRVMGYYAMITDITEFKMIQKRLLHLARVDGLTGLPNRAELLDRLVTALARCRRTATAMACLYLDIDRFKEVNDTLGHAGGDCVLTEFSRRLRQCVRESDTIARLSGDEFAIVLEDIGRSEEAQGVAAKIIACMAVPFNIEGQLRVVTTSIGVALANPLEDDPRSLLRAADAALYRAKRAGRNRLES
ncbi:sensor domain-containing diguanylate cyclase [Massilia phyllosphaerae]|uniref:sensor domain-containing diguanylate cyclase n=1 Tax=Massilia phyllosphaerae TaxID=3106034 RepID=UPI002B1CE089|nr:diguanylate cyclase [Massilia sp. SGZ-792]